MQRFKNVLLIALMVVAIASVPIDAQIQSVRDATSAFIKESALLASAARTASGDSGSPIDAAAYSAAVVLIDVTAVSGTTPSMTVTVEVCEDSGTTKCGYAHTAGAAITATGKQIIKVNNFGRFVRISYAISGTTPSFTFAAKAAFKPTT